MKKLIWLSAIIWVGCVGRHVDINDPSFDNRSSNSIELKTSKASMVVFGAGWCRPCIHEIATIEEIHQEFSEYLEVVGYLVEGKTPLSAPTQSEINDFQNDSVKRTYPVYPDQGWQKYSRFNFFYRTVPTIIIFDENKNVVDYKQVIVSKSELKIWLLNKLNIKHSK